MDCKQCDSLLVAYAKGELAEEDAAVVERHLRHCETCRWNAEAARQSLDLVKDATEEGGPVARIASVIIHRAIAERASDIHIDPVALPGPEETVVVAGGPTTGAPMGLSESDLAALAREEGGDGPWLRVRYRIDGVLREVMHLPGYVLGPLACRFLVLAEMNPFERRVPQFGRVHVLSEGKPYDLRVTTLPGTQGMSLIIRLLDRSVGVYNLDDLGLSEVNRQRIETACRQPMGLFLVCGPAGSGRTTLLYGMLSQLNRPGVSVMTVEDPVEVDIPGITQMHLNRKMGLTYPPALEAFLRSDPDIVMCANVPDADTASALVRLAITGHLVLAPIACGDAAEGIAKLVELASDALPVAHTLIGAVSLRLVRKVCAECAQDVVPSEAELQFLRRAGITEPPARLRRGRGCQSCRQTGYFGRTGIHEVLLLEGIPELGLLEPSGIEDLRALVRPAMLEDAAAKVVAGVTTAEEALRVVASLLRG